MRRAFTLAAVCLATGLVPAQGPSPARDPGVVHAPRLRLDPVRAFDHVERGAERARAHRRALRELAERGSPHAEPPPAPRPERRPTGARRYVAAVVACADADFDIPALLLQRRSDLLVLSNPGPVLRRDEIVLLERAIDRDQVPLCLVLVHDDCPTAADRERARPGQRPWTAREYGEIVARHLLRQSRVANRAQRLGWFEVAVGVVAPNGDVTWHTSALEAPPIDRADRLPHEVSAPPAGASPPARPERH